METKSDDDDDSINDLEGNDSSNGSEGEESIDFSSDDSLDESAIPEDKREYLQLLKEKAKNGDVEAMKRVSVIYFARKVYDKGVRYHKMAASHGDLWALRRLAEDYLDGSGVSQNVNKGLQYYEQAADRGSWDAMWDLARIYVLGRHGVTRDYDKVRQICENWADAGHNYAQYILALFYQGRDRDGDKIPGAKVDETKAFELFHKSAELNHEDSCTSSAAAIVTAKVHPVIWSRQKNGL